MYIVVVYIQHARPYLGATVACYCVRKRRGRGGERGMEIEREQQQQGEEGHEEGREEGREGRGKA